jgi:DNA-binding GntR family transcriptional regulator
MSLSRLESSIRRPANLRLHVYEAVANSIARGDLRPGARIVVEHMAQQLGVSQTPVREALGRLINEGLFVECGVGRFQVAHLTPAYVSDTFLVRGALEGLAAELAAPRLSTEQLAEIVKAQEEADISLSQGDVDAYVRFDRILHRSIFEAAGNTVLLRQLVPLQVHVDFIRHYSREYAGEHISCSHAEHGILINALCSGDARRSREAMETHIRQAGARIVRLIDFHSRSAGEDAAEKGMPE